MKRLIKTLLLSVLAAALCAFPAFAGGSTETLQDSGASADVSSDASDTSSAGRSSYVAGQPKLIVTNFSLDKGALEAGGTDTLRITVHNTSKKRAIRNLKMSFSENSTEIIPVGIGTKYLSRIKADGWYQWSFEVTALAKAESGVHPASVTMEYDDSEGNAYTASDAVNLIVRQPVSMSYDEPILDARMTQGDTPTFSMNLMNTGKSPIYNAMLTFDLPGIANGGSVLVGTIGPGETKTGTANFRVETDALGDVNGSVLLTYEDDFGEKYRKKLKLSTTIAEKQIAEMPDIDEKESRISGKTAAVIAVVGGGALLLIVILTVRAVRQKRAREEDEKRL